MKSNYLKMTSDLVTKVETGDKTNTCRMVRPQPTINGLTHEWHGDYYSIVKDKNNDYPIIKDLIKNCKVAVGDVMELEVFPKTPNKNYSVVKVEILNIKINRMFSLSEMDLVAEGLKMYPDSKNDGEFHYFDYLKREFTCTLNESWQTLMVSIYGVRVLAQNPYVYLYEFKKV